MRIAICDDSEGDRKRLADALADYLRSRDLSAEVKTFARPDSLLEAVRREDYDVYLLDILMPMVSGIAAARELREMKGKVPIVFFTTSSDYALAAFGVKAIDYVLKPWTSKEFSAALDAAVSAATREAGAVWPVKTLTGVRRVRPERIMCAVTSGNVRNVLVVWLEGGEQFEIRESVLGLYEKLSEKVKLLPVGKSMLVNPAYICSVEGTTVVLVGGKTLLVPKTAVPALCAAVLAV